eukprot:comp17625_c1_seq2/m.17335 comp17625_c1_seq2/g.17335  ORF comp17625_c1_seq2/g.17335 comp17625_c1_seq2/m.17335 type:complete len:366 (-) comp17625_c1_seq2:249-1346(-)
MGLHAKKRTKRSTLAPNTNHRDLRLTPFYSQTDIVADIENKRRSVRSQKQRKEETLDPPEILEEKIERLAEWIRGAQHAIVYTGAGLSTAASIPDYRGPNGLWTKMEKGEETPHVQPIEQATPTHGHMCITQLVHAGHIKHVVSQNCDGLHLRSGLPRENLSEIHGNTYIEVCPQCHTEYIRPLDVTKASAFRRHKTGRMCNACGCELQDTIVHFGEKGGNAPTVHNWQAAHTHSNTTDLIICLGSSLKVLRHYPIWGAKRPKAQRPKLAIVNLQWTPKDTMAGLKLNAKCDDVLMGLAKQLGVEVPAYSPDTDGLQRLVGSLATGKGEPISTQPDPLSTVHTGDMKSSSELPVWLRGTKKAKYT